MRAWAALALAGAGVGLAHYVPALALGALAAGPALDALSYGPGRAPTAPEAAGIVAAQLAFGAAGTAALAAALAAAWRRGAGGWKALAACAAGLAAVPASGPLAALAADLASAGSGMVGLPVVRDGAAAASAALLMAPPALLAAAAAAARRAREGAG